MLPDTGKHTMTDIYAGATLSFVSGVQRLTKYNSCLTASELLELGRVETMLNLVFVFVVGFSLINTLLGTFVLTTSSFDTEIENNKTFMLCTRKWAHFVTRWVLSI